MRFFFWLCFITYWSFLILAPLNAFAADKTFTCKPVVAGMLNKNGKLYLEEKYDKSTPILDSLPDNQFLLRGEAKDVYFKNNLARSFEMLIPYEVISLIEEIKEIHEGLSGWDNMVALENVRTYYLRYSGGSGSESLKRISINETNTRTAILTVPLTADFPSYFGFFNCIEDSANKNIEIEYNPSKTVS